MNKFDLAKETLVIQATRVAGNYLLAKYGQAHLIGEPVVELKATEGPVANSYAFSGTISVKADTGLLNPVVGVNMTVNSNDIEVESEENVQTRIETALRAEQTPTEQVVASLDAFKLISDGSKYLLVKHASLQDSVIGIVGKAEYATSKDKVALLKSIVKDAFPQTKIAFEGSFVEPVIEKVARGCDQCEATMINGVFCHETGCPNARKERFQEEQEDIEVESKPEESWLTDIEPPMAGAEFMEYQCPVCMESFEDYDLGQHDKSCPGTPEVMHDDKPAISISENMPRASMTDHLAQSIQAEEQIITAANEKIKTEVVNVLVNMLHQAGYGTAKVAEVFMTENKIDTMVTLDDAGTIKAVNIPVEIKASKIVLPKKTLVAELISKGLDINAKLSEEFSKEVLLRIVEADEKAAYEKAEAEAIINEKVASLDKTAGDEPSTQFMGTNQTVILNKHLIPASVSDLEIGDIVHIDGVSYKLVSTSSQQLSKGEQDSSQWIFERVTPVAK